MMAAMSARVILGGLYLLAMTPAVAQPVAEKSGPAVSEARSLSPSAARADRLDAAYAWLRQARDNEEAETARVAVAALLSQPQSPSAELLVQETGMAMLNGEDRVAERLLDHMAQIWPDEPQVFLMRGRLREAQGDRAAALAAYDQSLEREPRNIEALLAKGMILRDLKRMDEALKVFQQVLAIAPQLEAARGLAREVGKYSRDL
jgi:tetratricopeptide (TPR) repeat protein